MTEEEMVEWHHRLNGHESEQTQGDSEGQGSLAYCSPRGRRVRQDLVTEQQCAHQKVAAESSDHNQLLRLTVGSWSCVG